MAETGFVIKQDSALEGMIESSLFRCRHSGLSDFETTLPPVTPEAKARSRRHVSGHTMLIRESSPEYYTQLTASLAAHNACLMYVAPNGDVYGRYGNQELKDELKAVNVRFGTSMDEDVIGTNAVSLSGRYPKGVWVMGEQNYAKALWPYAFYCFTVHGKYNRYVHVLLAVRVDKLDEETASLFKLIDATESIFSAGLLTEDVLIKDALLKYNYSQEKTENILIVVGSNSQITYVNDIFYNAFKTDYNAVINYPLGEIVPELGYVLKEQNGLGDAPEPRHLRFEAVGAVDFYVTCTPANKKSPLNGMVITAQRAYLSTSGNTAAGNGAKYGFDDLIGVSDKFTQLKSFAKRIADTNCTVLIRGESGTGKELFAHSIHSASDRNGKPFISVNCAAIPRDLIGSELFGYVGGAFTGASRTGARGKFELADGGTLFLDEIAEMPPDMQSVLLRVLEDKAITRIGGSRPTPVDVRLIVATNQDIETYIKQGKFRLDLYYRLNIIALNMIPLRERKEDISALADSFFVKFAKLHDKQIDGMSAEARSALLAYSWPGNVRELRNLIERGVVTCDGRVIELSHLSAEITGAFNNKAALEPEFGMDKHSSYFNVYRRETVEQLMKEYDGNKTKVAKKMNIARTTLYRILKEIDNGV